MANGALIFSLLAGKFGHEYIHEYLFANTDANENSNRIGSPAPLALPPAQYFCSEIGRPFEVFRSLLFFAPTHHPLGISHTHGWAHTTLSPGQAPAHDTHSRPAPRTPSGKQSHVPWLVPYQLAPAAHGPSSLARPHHARPWQAWSRPPSCTLPMALPSHRPAPAAHGPPGQARAPTRRTATLPQHAQDSQAQYGSTSGCPRRIYAALRSRPQIAPARHGPAPLNY